MDGGVVLLFTMAVIGSLIAIRQAPPEILLYNADSLWVEDFYRYIFIEGEPWRTWSFPGAPNILDIFIYSVFRFTSTTILGAYISFYLAQLLILFGGVYVLSKSFGDTHRFHLRFSAFFIILYCIGVMVDLGAPPIERPHPASLPFALIVLPAFHHSVIVIIPLFLGMILTILKNRMDACSLLILFVLSTVHILSDNLAIVQQIAPSLASLSVIVCLARNLKKKALMIMGVLCLAMVAAHFLEPIVFPMRFQVPFDFKNLLHDWPQVSAFFRSFYNEYIIFRFALYSYVIIGGFTLSSCWRTSQRRLRPGPSLIGNWPASLFLLLFATTLLPLNFLAIMVIHNYNSRYLLGSVFVLLSFWPFLLASKRMGWAKERAFQFMVPMLGAIILWGGGFPALFKVSFWEMEYYPPIVKCLDENASRYGLKYGMADYWISRLVNIFSREHLRTIQVHSVPMQEFDWAVGKNDFLLAPFNFVVADTAYNLPVISSENLVRYRQPTATFYCDKISVHVYSDGIKAFSPEQIVISLQRSGQVRISPHDLPTLTGAWDGTFLSNGRQAGFLQYGPFITLPAGHYTVTWSVRTNSSTPTPVTLDVMAEGAMMKSKAMKLSNGKGAPNEKKQAVPSLTFELYKKTSQVEWRFLVHEAVEVAIFQVLLTWEKN